MKLIEKCNKAIDVEIREDARNEAKEILKLSSKKIRKEFLDYHKKDSGNICCLVLDKAKQDLIKENKMILSDDDNFGHPMF